MGPANRVCARLWVFGFAITAVAAFLGGTFHGFRLQLLWNPTIFLVGAGGAFLVAGGLASTLGKGRKVILSGIAVSAIGAAIQATGFRRGLNFNHNDIFHVVQIVALYLLFRGSLLVEDKRTHL